MKHILLDVNGKTHATIIGCPFKYTIPRNMTVIEDNPVMGKLAVDHFKHTNPKCHDDTQAHATDFAVIRDGIVESVIVWGGAEWCPPQGTTLIPIDKWMGTGDVFNHDTITFSMHNDRKGKRDKDKTVKELQADMDAINSPQGE